MPTETAHDNSNSNDNNNNSVGNKVHNNIQVDLNSVSTTSGGGLNGEQQVTSSSRKKSTAGTVSNTGHVPAEEKTVQSTVVMPPSVSPTPTLDPEIRESVSILESEIIKTIENSNGKEKVEDGRGVRKGGEKVVSGIVHTPVIVEDDFVTPIVETIPEDEKIEIIKTPSTNGNKVPAEEDYVVEDVPNGMKKLVIRTTTAASPASLMPDLTTSRNEHSSLPKLTTRIVDPDEASSVVPIVFTDELITTTVSPAPVETIKSTGPSATNQYPPITSGQSTTVRNAMMTNQVRVSAVAKSRLLNDYDLANNSYPSNNNLKPNELCSETGVLFFL